MDIVDDDIKPTPLAKYVDAIFGLAHLLEGAAGCTGETFSSTFRNGTVRFFSFEQLRPEREGQRKTMMMEIWAFRSLLTQVLSGEPPYRNFKAGYLACVEVIQGNLPMNSLVQLTLNPAQKSLWRVVNLCWLKDPTSRPTASKVVDEISEVLVPTNGGSDTL